MFCSVQTSVLFIAQYNKDDVSLWDKVWVKDLLPWVSKFKFPLFTVCTPIVHVSPGSCVTAVSGNWGTRNQSKYYTFPLNNVFFFMRTKYEVSHIFLRHPQNCGMINFQFESRVNFQTILSVDGIVNALLFAISKLH